MRSFRDPLLALAALVASGCADPTPRHGDAGLAGDGSAADASADAGSADAAASPDASPELDGGPLPPAIYPAGVRHSPIPADVADRMRAISARGVRRDDVLAKIGDSITVSTSFLQCFTSGAAVDLGGRDALRVTLDHFAAGDAVGSDPFRRVSLSAGVGWTAARALEGDPAPLDQETTAIEPRFAVVMYGTNDVGFVDYDAYARNMTEIVDRLIDAGTIPLLSSIPPRDDDAAADARVPVYVELVRALAASRGVPFVDLHRELLAISGHGLAGDGVHLQASSLGACVLTDAGLTEGANVRNLLTLEQLDRARRVVLDGEDAIDGDAPRLVGAGTRADPFVVGPLPFAGWGDTRTGGEDAIDRWDACSTADESGPELRFRFHLGAPARVTAAVSSGSGADLDVHVVPAGGGASDCLARGDRSVDVDLGAGDWDVVADTYAGGGAPLAGPFFVAIVPR